MTCSRCGRANTPGSRFCVNCGQPLIIVPATAAAGRADTGPSAAIPSPAYMLPQHSTPPALDPNSPSFWIGEVKRYGWRLWPVAVLIVYVFWTKNVMVLAIGLTITWFIRKYSSRIDEVLAPVWPYRNRIPRPSRKILGWIVPVAISLFISLTPATWRFLGWLPIVGPTASLTIFTALIAASVAYVLVREPSHAGAR